jgi:tripartite-type tricarboxylate transporter receptor subunit TctC
MGKNWFAFAALGVVLFGLTGCGAADEPAPAAQENTGAVAADTEFFRGKTVTYIVATAPGGGYDTYGRLIARYMQKYLPGSRFIVRNVPGAGQIIGANTIYVAPADGLTIGTFNTGLIYAQILQQEGVRFDLGRMSWIGKMAEEGRSLAVSALSGFQSVDDLRNAPEPVILSSAGIGSASYIETRIMERVLGLDVQIITGYDGNETQLSMMRGELNGVLGAASSNVDFVNRGDGKFLVSIAGARSALPGVPQVREFVTNPADMQLLNLVETMAELGRLTAGPPNITPERLRALRDAFNTALTDPELLEEAERMLIPITVGTGEEVTEKVRVLLDQTPEVIELLHEAAQGT